MQEHERPKGNGLKWRKRKTRPPVPYWFADEKAIKAGYPVKSANLSQFADRPLILEERVARLQSEMLLWMSGERESKPRFNGTFGSLIRFYESDKESPFNTDLKPGVKDTYAVYIRKLIAHIGELRIDHHDGRDLKRWFAQWRGDPDGSDHLPRGKMVLAVLKAAVSFGIACRYPGCAEFQTAIREIEFPAPKSRTFAPTADQIVGVRKAAHAANRPRRALLYALAFETTGRYFDFFGQWMPISYKKPSAVLFKGRKWIGPMWSAIDSNLIMTITPTKTEDTTEVEISFDLSTCPMVLEELAHIPIEERKGPIIISERSGLPYLYHTFRLGWRKDFKAAGLPTKMWCRDIRAGGITEGGKAGGTMDDLRRTAGHAKPKMTERYDRDQIEAQRRTMKYRTTYRENDKKTS